ncbi:PAS domain-containing sensor histidine kinase [Ekhidna sp. To15]|uniref:PAS domain-containing sensor histidine kinase n=1 Tax=Ekhidna sp. To15 TaxID=3395267 RepID=UPI003F528FBB
MKKFLSKINQAGLEGLEDPLNYRRVLFVNNISLVSSGVSFLVTLLVAFEGLFPQFIITFCGGLLFLFVIYFNSKQYYSLARFSFLIISVGLLTVASYTALGQGRFNEVENILIGFMAVNYLLYDGRFRYIGFILIYGVLLWLKFMKQGHSGLPYDLNFYLTIQNVTILCLLLFLFVHAFRKSLLKAFLKLKEKDELLYSMIDNVPLYIGLLDQEMRYKMVNINYERSFGVDRDKIIGSHVNDVLPENILSKHLPMIEQALKGESPEFLELTKMPNGNIFYAGGRYSPVRTDTGEISGISVFVNDVSKLEEAKNKLKAANSTKDKLFSIIAHDIRGPLDLFDGLVDYSSSGNISKEEFIQHQKSVKNKLSDLKETVNTLLEWARTQLDGINTFPTPTNINDIVKSNLELYEGLIAKKNIMTSVDIVSDAIAYLDANHLKIGVRNMIHNSLKFTEKDGTLSIRGVRKESKVILEIEDNGLGMEAKRIESILNKDLQNSKSGTEGEGGTGLGLSFSLELLEKNNCDVKIESEVGNGTKIIISMQADIGN